MAHVRWFTSEIFDFIAPIRFAFKWPAEDQTPSLSWGLRPNTNMVVLGEQTPSAAAGNSWRGRPLISFCHGSTITAGPFAKCLRHNRPLRILECCVYVHFASYVCNFIWWRLNIQGRPEKRGIHAFGIRPMAANINPGQFSTPSSFAHSHIRFVWFAIALEFNAHPVGVDRRSWWWFGPPVLISQKRNHAENGDSLASGGQRFYHSFSPPKLRR